MKKVVNEPQHDELVAQGFKWRWGYPGETVWWGRWVRVVRYYWK